jgi:hypothetical protein
VKRKKGEIKASVDEDPATVDDGTFTSQFLLSAFLAFTCDVVFAPLDCCLSLYFLFLLLIKLLTVCLARQKFENYFILN